MQKEIQQITTLEGAREQIDKVDSAVVELLEKRLRLVERVIDIKKRDQLPIYQPHRELEILERITNRVENDTYAQTIKEIYIEIMKSCKRLQSRYLVPYNIVLVGFMGAGKSSLGKYLSGLMEMPLVDIDELLSERMKMSINQIFDVYGESFFRKMETHAVYETSYRKNLIISCGGGVVLNPENISLLKQNGKIIWLKADAETLYNRLHTDETRPLLKNNLSVSHIDNLLSERAERYAGAADFEIDTDHLSIEEIGQQIIDFIAAQNLEK